MGRARSWTKAEYEQLAEEWGRYSIPVIARHLNRTCNGIRIKAQRLGLGAFLDSSQYVTLNVLFNAIGIRDGYTYTLEIFKKAGLKIHMQQVESTSFQMIDIDEFWKWAEGNKGLIDFSRFEKGTLGREPDWCDKKRQEDYIRSQNIKPHNSQWSIAEDKELLRLLRAYKYTYREISMMLHRSEGAIQRRVLDLGIKERPIKADNHDLWTDEQLYTVGEMIKDGSNYENMSLVIGKSAKAIRGKVYSVYLSENLDKVRKILGNGDFGDNRPQRLLKQRGLMSLEEKGEVKQALGTLAGILAYQIRKQFNDQDNWQRHLCGNWDEVKGCTAGETDCDTCSSFVRIRPQYCARCGKTFYERQENRMCQGCRVQRKKLGYKKYLRNQSKPHGSLF